MQRKYRMQSRNLRARLALSSGKSFLFLCLGSMILFVTTVLFVSNHQPLRSLMALNTEKPTRFAGMELPMFLQQHETDLAKIEASPNNNPTEPPTAPSRDVPTTDKQQEENAEANAEPEQGTKPDPKPETKPETKSETKSETKVLVYHTHNRESFFPELKEGAKAASSGSKNITSVGNRLTEQLIKRGIGTIHSKTDYPSTVKGFHFSFSYKYSKKTVTEVMASDENVDYFLDIHRDSQKWKKTTVGIKGKNYAKVMFVIGQKNKNWKQNEKLARRLDKLLDEKYPGLSRGILNKGPGTGNAEFNQSLSPNSLVVEVGGVDNDFEELNRTADALAEVMAIIIAQDR